VSTDVEFLARFAEQAAAIPGVEAVTLGGSRASGEHEPESDWDFAIYYRGRLDPDDVRAVGWAGSVFAPGDWGGGVMNGGAWLEVEGRRVDLHYRDRDQVEHWWADARAGRFEIERLPFYLAGIPTYAVVAELALQEVLVGSLPRPEYPSALRVHAQAVWHDCASMTLDYAARAYAARGDALGAAGTLARAVIEEAHSRLAARGVWCVNEKRIVARAGLDRLTGRFGALGQDPGALLDAVAAVRDELESPVSAEDV
jgi:predicted nucleotidyltransferase